MNTALRQVFDSVKDAAGGALDDESKGTVTQPRERELLTTGEAIFPFHLDENGSSRTEVEERGYGVTVNCKVWLQSPDATYSLKITSSAGTNETWHGVRVNQELSFKLKTEDGLAKTKIIVEGSANVTNVNGLGKIAYDY